MNRRIFIAAAAVLGSTFALPHAASADSDPSQCDPYTEDCTVCEFDPSLLASSPACDPCLYPDDSTIDPECEETTTTTTPPDTTEPPTTEPPATEPPTTAPPSTEPDTTTSTVEPQERPEEPTTTVDPDQGALPQAPATTAVAANTPQLPKTGGNGATTSVIALGFLAAGAALVAASRRPQRAG